MVVVLDANEGIRRFVGFGIWDFIVVMEFGTGNYASSRFQNLRSIQRILSKGY